MSQEKALYFLPRPDGPGDCWRIKVDANRNAVLAFGSLELARYFSQRHGIDSEPVLQHQLSADVVACGSLVVFRSAAAIDAAHEDRGAYDFSTHLEQWPPA